MRFHHASIANFTHYARIDMCPIIMLLPETPQERRDISIIVGLIGSLAVMVIQ